ncbi:Na+/H+ antiporter NhaC [Bacillus sp. ISL-4]|uniref:Na+/H+ antiporter NhaC n=1 Tax=Bacillus sp. ISL-4 TaxID=2819125 RepID=UPI001BEA40F9|nr:Na+/H+ antiporter NhaC [Bacillus sp. ISL-4]MBT2667276.1 Na+/H+ antiporter NhaC [Bacillus sp. ISL-4]MBT2670582.1 Na+/H+ antiporter NhaC [Streptomyces sp. ISL-14]
MSNVKQPSLFQAIIPLLIIVISAAFSILRWNAGMFVPLLTGIVTTALLGLYLGYKWGDLEKFLSDGVSRALTAIFMLFIIGSIIGTWILSGVIPTLIYYGLDILSPDIFLPTVAITTAILGLATGSSFTAIATIGLAFMAVGQGIGFPPALVAGTIISGALFGDKLSALSDTTNLTPAMVGTDLFSHIKHMLWDSIPAFAICLVLYYFFGMKYSGNSVNLEKVSVIMDALNQTFTITPVLLLLPVLTIYIVTRKFPAIPSLLLVSFLGGITAMAFQGSSLSQVIQSMTNGYTSQSGLKLLDSLLNQGGMKSMFELIALVILATAFGGILEGTGVLKTVLNSFINKARTTGSLIFSTILSTLIIGFASGAQYLAIILPARAFVGAYKQRGLDTKNLSRCVEAAGTVGINLVPWSVNALFAAKVLGVSPTEFIPFIFFSFLIPLINLIYGYTGISIVKKAYPETGTDSTSKTEPNEREVVM